VADRELPARIARRAAGAAVVLQPDLSAALAGYLDLLGRWNRKINLTALTVDPPDDEAIDRLIVEPLAAARHVGAADRVVIDIGSGGGSPALPLKLAVPRLRFVLVEAKVRKAAFLREAVRHLSLPDVRVEANRLEDLVDRADLRAAADIVTIRAVRIDAELLDVVKGLVTPGGRVFAFTGQDLDQQAAGAMLRTEPLVPSLASRLSIFGFDRG
jgi:16S rRNA (guanine527-N7)-methyltransferase